MTPEELANRYFLSRILWWRHDLAQLDAMAVKELIKTLAASNSSIRQQIHKELPQLWNKISAKEYRLWLGETTQKAIDATVDTISEAWTISASQSLNAYNSILSFDSKAQNVRQIPITPDEVKKLAAVSPFPGTSLAMLVGAVFHDGVMGEVLQCIDEGMKEGWGYKKVVDKLFHESIDKGFQLTQTQAITLSRSYIQQASVNAQMAVYEKNSDVVKGVKWTAILDNRVCGKCAALDGMKFALNDIKPKMIAHPRCRCLWLPWLKSFRDLGIDMDDLEEAARPWLLREPGNIDSGGRKILFAGTSKENFSGWWKTLPYEEQIKSIGPTRTKLINEGKLTWEDLVDRKTGRYYTLKELDKVVKANSSLSDIVKLAKSDLSAAQTALEKLPPELAQIEIRRLVKEIYPKWSENPQGNLPLVVLSKEDAELIGAKKTITVISAETLQKQKKRHPELIVDDYVLAQEAVNSGEKYQQNDLNLAFALNMADGVVVIVKGTRNGEELYVTSLRRMSKKETGREHALKNLRKGKK